ncbi:hypothetical protein [Cohaesibacter celericrescens]|uniref:DUF2059 domain-containing protein n=1 Tax=Cohaesibacter celericrescens TaxID=2067669 RepID=A0A2N5XX39_9HYPH|nr:hypothetical protein [Cohaesibacter celericrescens]PLW79059.1 hypothetical protein C0081_02175 [Cohaesibacter celericrescens]
MRKSSFVTAIYSLLAGAFVSSSAFAQEVQGYQIDTAPLVQMMLPYVETLLMAGVAVVTTWLSAKANKYLGVQLDAKHRATIESVIQSRLRQALAYAADQHAPIIQTKRQLLKSVSDYVISKAPDAVKHFGLSPADLESMILGRVGTNIKALTEARNVDAGSNGSGQGPLDLTDGLGAGPNAQAQG